MRKIRLIFGLSGSLFWFGDFLNYGGAALELWEATPQTFYGSALAALSVTVWCLLWTFDDE